MGPTTLPDSTDSDAKLVEYLVANITGRCREETLNGRQYLIAPLVMIVPGVLNGSKGPLLYPEEEISRDPSIWNGVPITNGHPSINGKPVSARSPEVVDKFQLGTVYNAIYDGKLRAEGWFDVEKTKSLRPDVLNTLRSGKPKELSTGLFTDNEPVEGTFNSKQYKFIARNYRGDHLAVLDTKGACSVEDGCGVNVNEEGSEIVDRVDLESLEPGDKWERVVFGVDESKYRITRNAKTKTVDGESLPVSAFAYVPDPDKSSTWKLRIDDAQHVGGAIAALGKGFRGQKVEIPTEDLTEVKARVRKAWLRFHPDKEAKDVPEVIRNEASHSEIRDKLNEILSGRYGSRAHVVEVYSKKVICRVVSDHNNGLAPSVSDSGDKYYVIGYTVAKDGKVTLSDQGATEVQKVTTYKPIRNEEDEESDPSIQRLVNTINSAAVRQVLTTINAGNCGIGPGRFQPGNKCAVGSDRVGGGKSKTAKSGSPTCV